MRNGRRVVLGSLDDSTGPVSNVVFFHEAQERGDGRVFATHFLLVRGRTRRSSATEVSVTGESLWDLLEVARQSQPRQRQQRAGDPGSRAAHDN